MLFVRANVECKLIQWPIIFERALIRVPICRSTDGRLNVKLVLDHRCGLGRQESLGLASLDQALDIT